MGTRQRNVTSTQTQNQDFSGTSSLQLPDWLNAASQQIAGVGSGLFANGGLGFSPLQQQAQQTAAGWNARAGGALGRADDIYTALSQFGPNHGRWASPIESLLGMGVDELRGLGFGTGSGGGGGGGWRYADSFGGGGGVSARSFLDADLNAYMNPYIDAVVNDQIADIERAGAMQLNRNAAALRDAGAFGGSRHGVIDALTNSEIQRNVGQASNAGRAQAFNIAAGLISGDNDRALQAAIADAQSRAAGAAAANSAALARDQMRLGLFGDMLSAALGYGNMGYGADERAAGIRGQAGDRLLNFGAGGMNAAFEMGDPWRNILGYGQLLGGLPTDRTETNRGSGSIRGTLTQPMFQNRGAGGLGGALAGSQFGPWGALVGGLLGAFG
jgi:hypothetical protein